MRKDIKEIQKRIQPILRQHGVVRASVFGSVAKNEAKNDSDLDLLIEFGDKKTLLDMAALHIDLEQEVNYPRFRSAQKQGLPSRTSLRWLPASSTVAPYLRGLTQSPQALGSE